MDFLEDTVIQFIIDMTHKAMEIGRPGRVQVTSRDEKECNETMRAMLMVRSRTSYSWSGSSRGCTPE